MSVAESVWTSTAAVSENIPRQMQAAVYLGKGRVAVQSVPTPAIARGELLVRVEACGVCHTDLKKIEYGLLAPPRIYGHETAGVVVAVGEGVARCALGDHVVAFHHIPCGHCFYCERHLYAQCPTYKKVGVTAGFEPAGGGFAQYIRIMDWIVERGVEKIPAGVSFDQACWVEPVNTCLKGVELLAPRAGDVVAVLGQGPIGLIFTMLLRLRGVTVLSSDTMQFRRSLSAEHGAYASDPSDANFESSAKAHSAGRGVDSVILATSAKGLVEQAIRISRPGAKILLFAQTSATERIEVSGADICVGERMLFGSYSADVDLQAESARLVFSGQLPLQQLISDCVSLSEIERGISIAQKPGDRSLKVVVHPQERISCQ